MAKRREGTAPEPAAASTRVAVAQRGELVAKHSTDYRILKAVRGYQAGQIVRNWPKRLILEGLQEGWLEELAPEAPGPVTRPGAASAHRGGALEKALERSEGEEAEDGQAED